MVSSCFIPISTMSARGGCLGAQRGILWRDMTSSSFPCGWVCPTSWPRSSSRKKRAPLETGDRGLRRRVFSRFQQSHYMLLVQYVDHDFFQVISKMYDFLCVLAAFYCNLEGILTYHDTASGTIHGNEAIWSSSPKEAHAKLRVDASYLGSICGISGGVGFCWAMNWLSNFGVSLSFKVLVKAGRSDRSDRSNEMRSVRRSLGHLDKP